MAQVPRVVIAAPASGSGKTTVATGLMAALAARGMVVSGHKVGPDYIDPGYHALATGRPPRNLDPVLCGEERLPALFAHGAAGADIAVIEGVMGLFDGASKPERFHGPGDYASTAHVAGLLRAPVVLVVDAARTSRSIAALLHGFVSYDTGVRVAGVILNQVGSDRHEALLRAACEEVGVPVLGAVRRAASVAVPSRHLGLVPATERAAEARAAVTALGELVACSCDLDALTAVARTAGPLAAEAWDAHAELAAVGYDGPADVGGAGSVEADRATGFAGAAGSAGPARAARLTEAARATRATGVDRAMGTEGIERGEQRLADGPPRVRIAVAGGPAFTFSYTEQAELLAAGGAEVVTFDPLRDERLPEGTAGLVIGGGFPEVHAAELSANGALRTAVAALVRDGAPVAAECAGLLYLCRDVDGQPMCGVLPAEATMTERLTLGYRAAVAVGDSPLAPTGTRVHGHEFHRTVVTPAHGERAAWQWSGASPEGFASDTVHASYLHVHWAGHPAIAARFLVAAHRYESDRHATHGGQRASLNHGREDSAHRDQGNTAHRGPRDNTQHNQNGWS